MIGEMCIMQQTSKVGRLQPHVVDYSAARAKAIEWLGDRYLLAKPVNRKTSPPTSVPSPTPGTLGLQPAGHSRRPFDRSRVAGGSFNVFPEPRDFQNQEANVKPG